MLSSQKVEAGPSVLQYAKKCLYWYLSVSEQCLAGGSGISVWLPCSQSELFVLPSNDTTILLMFP